MRLLVWLTGVSSCRRQSVYFFNTGWVTDPQTGHKPANGVVMQTTACNGNNCCCCCCYWLAKCLQSSIGSVYLYCIYTEYDKRLHGQHKQDGCTKNKLWDAVGCCISVISGSPAVFHLVFFSTQYIYKGKLKTNPKKPKNTNKGQQINTEFPPATWKHTGLYSEEEQ